MSESDSRNQHKECNLPLSPLRSPLLSHFDLPTDFLNNDAHLFNENDLFGSNTFGVFSHSSSPSIPQITQDPGINSFFKDEHKLGGISQMHASQSSLKSEPANVSSEEPLFYDSGLPIDGLGTPFSPAGLGYQHQLSNHTPTPPPLEATETLESQEEQRHRNSPSPVTTRRRVNSGSHQSIDRLTEEFDGLVPAYDDQESEEEREDTNDKNNKYLPPHVSSLLQSSKVVHSSSTPSSSSSSNRHSVLHSTAASQVQSEELSTISQRKKNGTLCLGNFLFNCTAERPTENRVRPFGRCDACLRGKSVPLSRARVSRFTFSSANRKTLIAATSAHGAIKCEKFPNVYKDWCLFVFQTEEDARRSTVALGDVGEEPALQEVHGVLPRHIWTTGVPFFRSGKHNKLIPQPIKSDPKVTIDGNAITRHGVRVIKKQKSSNSRSWIIINRCVIEGVASFGGARLGVSKKYGRVMYQFMNVVLGDDWRHHEVGVGGEFVVCLEFEQGQYPAEDKLRWWKTLDDYKHGVSPAIWESAVGKGIVVRNI